MTTPRILVQEAPFDVAAEMAALSAGRTDVGAIASFTGLVRDDRGRADDGLLAMVLEHYPAMTQRALEGIAAEAMRRWPLSGCTVIHRVGRLEPADRAGAHR
jgi:molybdopterin synthase catalytic subunit